MGKCHSISTRIFVAVALTAISVASEQRVMSKANMDRKQVSVESSSVMHARNLQIIEKRQKNSSSNFSNAYLVDSIITIVQNYYVDESRVESRKILESTLQNLVKNGLIHVELIGNEKYHLTQKERSLDINIVQNYGFDDLVSDSSSIAYFLENGMQELRARRYRSGAFAYLDALLSSLDPHSNLLSPDEYQDLRQGTDGSFGGLGIVVGIKDDVLTVVKPLPKSPAFRAGLSKSDKIMKIDGKSTFGSTLDDLVQYMRGEPGTSVSLSILSEGGKNPRNISLVREVVHVDSVESRVIPTDVGNIVYASIESFSSKTSSELKDVLIKTSTKAPILGLIMDLRSNPGGLLDQAVKVADLFLDDGKIVSTIGRSRDIEYARRNFLQFNAPIVVLMNGDTASASEIVAGALRDHGRALIVGEPSFGKGSVQTVFELPGEMALKLTIARYFTPAGISIQNRGIMPDFWLQPVSVAALEKNINVLGDFRYKGERFLDHTLDSGIHSKKESHDSRAFFYLKDKSDNDPDLPLEFAKNILHDLGEKEGVPFPLSRLRTSYWKASLFQKTNQYLGFLDDEASVLIKKKLGIEWGSREPIRRDLKNLSLEVDLPQRIRVGGKSQFRIPWKVVNRSEKDIDQVSVFASSSKSSVQTQESLIGRINAGETLEGYFPFQFGSKLEVGSIALKVGLACGGLPISHAFHEVIADVGGDKVPEIAANLRFIDDTSGKEFGVLESGEEGNLELSLVNRSQKPIDALNVTFINLSGKQFKISNEKVRVRTIKPGEVRIVKVRVEAGRDVFSSNLEVGVRVSIDNFTETKRSRFVIPSRPTPYLSRNVELGGEDKWKEN